MSAPLPAAIFFDLDDTILSFSAGADTCWLELCQEFASRLTELSPERLADSLNESRRWFWSEPERSRRGRLDLYAARRAIARRAFEAAGVDDVDTAHALGDAFTEAREERVHPFPGAVETLESLRAAGVRLALLTNGARDFQRRKIERFCLADFFDEIVIEGEFGVGKPDRRVFRHALAALEVAESDAWMVGDNLEADIRPALELGIHSVWVDHRDAGREPEGAPRPDHRVIAIRELLEA